MTKLKRLVAISILTASFSGAAFADGGETQGPPAPPSPPTACVDYSGNEASAATAPEDSSVDIVTTVELLATWLAMSIL